MDRELLSFLGVFQVPRNAIQQCDWNSSLNLCRVDVVDAITCNAQSSRLIPVVHVDLGDLV